MSRIVGLWNVYIISYDYLKQCCLLVSKSFPIKDGWFVHLGKCASASCKDRVDGRTTLQDCKERCMANPTCGMIKFRPSRSRCSLCQSSVLRKPQNGKPCTPENRYDFYIKGKSQYYIFRVAQEQISNSSSPPLFQCYEEPTNKFGFHQSILNDFVGDWLQQ